MFKTTAKVEQMMIYPPIGPVRALMLPWLNRRLGPALASGEMSFLEGRQVTLVIRGCPLALVMGLEQDQLWLDWSRENDPAIPMTDARLAGDAGALLLVAMGEADGDALFFQRRLSMEGDTELAMELKSILARFSLLPPLPGIIRQTLDKAPKLPVAIQRFSPFS